MDARSLFLYLAWFRMFCGVGLFFCISCSACCFRIFRLCLGSHHVFRRGLGVASWCSIVSLMACWMLVRCCEVVRLGWFRACIADFVSAMMAFLCLLYLLMESVLVFLCCWAVILVLKMVYVARWSVMGGEMVPAVVVVCVSVVSVTSMRVEVLWWESYLVGVVIVVCRLFSTRKLWKLGVSFRRLMLMSPCKVIEVPGFFV